MSSPTANGETGVESKRLSQLDAGRRVSRSQTLPPLPPKADPLGES